MRSSTKRNLSLGALLAALLVGGGLLPVAYQNRQASLGDKQVASAPAPAPGPGAAPAPAPAPQAEPATPAPPPGTEVVPAEEAETDRGPASASPAGPTLSFARAAGLNHAPDPLKLNSSVALLVNQDSGEVLVRKNDTAVLPIASLTKLMTSLVVAEAKQPLDEVLTITEEDVDTERHSRSRLRVGSKLTREEALRLALMSSENRAAHALGRAYPGGLDKMVAAMNARAQELGMKNSSFVDPTGLSNRNQSTARDLAVLVGAVARNQMLADMSTTRTHVASLGSRTLQYNNSNRLVRNDRPGWDIALQKTGYIVEAGRCLTMLTKVGGQKLIMVLLDADNNGARIADAERMRRWVVAEWGLADPAVAEAKAERKVVAKKARESRAESKRKTAVAKKDADTKGGKQEVVAAQKEPAGKDPAKKAASAKSGGKTAVAAKDGDKKDARVRQTFVAHKSGDKT